MSESGDIVIRPVVLLVAHVRLARGGEQAVFCGASSRRCKPLHYSFCLGVHNALERGTKLESAT